MFDTGKNLPARSRVTCILHLHRQCHVFCIVQSDQQLFLCLADGACQVLCGWFFTIVVEKRASVATGDLGGETIFGGTTFARARRRTLEKKDKGCDIGYALAASSCEGANNVEHAPSQPFDAITAFAVPNPNFSSQSRRFFRVWSPNRLPGRADHPIYFGLANFI